MFISYQRLVIIQSLWLIIWKSICWKAKINPQEVSIKRSNQHQIDLTEVTGSLIRKGNKRYLLIEIMMANPDLEEIKRETEAEGVSTLRLYAISMIRKVISL